MYIILYTIYFRYHTLYLFSLGSSRHRYRFNYNISFIHFVLDPLRPFDVYAVIVFCIQLRAPRMRRKRARTKKLQMSRYST